LQILDYGAARDGVPERDLGRRILVDANGKEERNDDGEFLELESSNDA
jgi:hypothetical protein